MMAISKNLTDREKAAFIENPVDGGTDKRVAITQVINDALAWSKFEVTVSASSTAVIDTNLLSSFSRIDYIINFKDDPVTVTKSLKVVVQNDAGDVSDVVSERMGGRIDVSVDVTDDAVDAFLEITNNESFDLTVTFLKSKI